MSGPLAKIKRVAFSGGWESIVESMPVVTQSGEGAGFLVTPKLGLRSLSHRHFLNCGRALRGRGPSRDCQDSCFTYPAVTLLCACTMHSEFCSEQSCTLFDFSRDPGDHGDTQCKTHHPDYFLCTVLWG